MKRLLQATIILIALHAYAGPGEGGGAGGGKGIVCRDSAGAIQTVELLDLWEARTIYSRNIVESNAPYEDQTKQAVDELMNSVDSGKICSAKGCLSRPETLQMSLMSTVQMFTLRTENVHFLKNVTLAITPDSNEVATPSIPGCAVEQIVRYEDTPRMGTVYVNDDIYSAMSPTQKAALIAHEALYKDMRRNGETNSVRVRRVIGGVFSGLKFVTFQELTPTDHIVCTSDNQTPGVGSRLEFFHSPLSTVFKPSAFMRIDSIANRLFFGGYNLFGWSPSVDVIAGLLKGEQTHSKAIKNYEMQGIAWEGGSKVQTKFIEDIENETALQFNYIIYKDGSIRLRTPSLDPRANPFKNNNFMKCHVATPDDL